MMNYKINLVAIILLLTTACTGGRSHQTANDSIVADSIDFAFPVTLKHAEQMSIINKPSHKELYLLNPDSHDTLAAYAFYPQGKPIPQGLSPKMKPIAVPLKSIACSSTPQVGAIAALGGENELVAINTLNNVNSPKVRERIDKGLIQEIARGSSRNNELLLSLHPDVLLMDFSDQREQDDELRRAGIEPMLFNSWKETSLLGRAEWLKVAGILLGKNQLADSLYRHITSEYEAAQAIIRNEADTVQILWGADYKGMWYVPGEYSYVTRMLHDAKINFDYIPQTVNSTPMSFEYIFSRHKHDKVWISVMVGKGNTLADFLALNERYTAFDAVNHKGIWLDRKRVNQYGGNDYWESAPYNPHLILKDLIKITRPHLLPDYETTYFLHLK